MRKTGDEDFEKWYISNNVKFYPKCKRRVEREEGPNMSCLCGYSWCWRCGGQVRDHGHEFRYLIGQNVWNIKRTIIILLIFAPILVYFMRIVITLIIMDMLNEGEDSVWIIRNRKYFYPLLAILSPVIEVLAVVGIFLLLQFMFHYRFVRKLGS